MRKKIREPLPEVVIGEVFEGRLQSVAGRLIHIDGEYTLNDNYRVRGRVLKSGHDRRHNSRVSMSLASLQQNYRHMPTFNVSEAAEYSGIAKSTLYDWIRAGKLECVTIFDGAFRIPQRALGPRIIPEISQSARLSPEVPTQNLHLVGDNPFIDPEYRRIVDDAMGRTHVCGVDLDVMRAVLRDAGLGITPLSPGALQGLRDAIATGADAPVAADCEVERSRPRLVRIVSGFIGRIRRSFSGVRR